MGKCYCDYCDVFLTNDSVAVRKQHNDGNRHKYNVCEYYRNYMGQQLQEQIDDIVQQFEIKVARGLVRPTYGLPPAVKPVKELENAPTSPVNQSSVPDHPMSSALSPAPASNDLSKADINPQVAPHDSALKIASSEATTALASSSAT